MPDRLAMCPAAVFLVAASLASAPASAAPADDFATLRKQVVAHYAAGAPSAQTVKQMIARLRDDGTWPDVDYTDRTRGGWATARHLYRVRDLAQAYAKPGHPLEGSADVRDAVVRALRHWIEKDYRNSNWWYTRIGVPKAVAPALLLMGDAVPEALARRAREQVLGRSTMGMTGQNKVWCAGIAFLKGLLAEDPGLMRKARDAIFSELRVTTAEGIQPDFSFHQHGPQQQWGNYGLSFAGDAIRWATMFRGTSFALEEERLAVLRRYVLDGLAWTVWHGRMDVSGCGRQIFRGAQRSKGRAVLRCLQDLARLDPSAADACRRTLAACSEGGPNTLVGHKHFWRSDISIHRRPGWYASVKMSSTRVIGAETCNSENMRGLHLGDGVLYVLRRGDEYADLFPVWNWRRLPGTTCRQGEESLVPGGKRCRGRSEFVGGVGDGRRGLAAMVYRRGGLTARKAWAFLDGAVVCLGAGITCDEDGPVVTSVNQCARRGPVAVSRAGGHRVIEKKGRASLDGPAWVWHDGVGYIFGDGCRGHVAAEAQTGDWHRVHHRYSEKTVSRDVFSLAIDHGTKPKAAAYAYTVLPGIAAKQMAQAAKGPPAEVVSHTPAVQAVSVGEGRVVLAAFFEAGRLAWGGGGTLAVDVPCLVLLDAASDEPHLYVADPTHKRKAVTVAWSLPAAVRTGSSAKRTGETRLALPTGPMAGSAVKGDL
ncbi:MAG: polysaccharide lyase 8 family protein [Phycisphaerae bacterium]